MPDLALNPLPLEDPKGGALSVTRASGIGAAIVAVLTTIDASWDAIFDAATPSWAKPVFLMVVVGAWSIIASADLLGRAHAKAHKAAAEAEKESAKTAAETEKEVAKTAAEAEKEAAKGGIRVIPIPGLAAVDRRDTDQDCWVTATRVDPAKPDEAIFLVIRADGSTRWAASTDLKMKPVLGPAVKPGKSP